MLKNTKEKARSWGRKWFTEQKGKKRDWSTTCYLQSSVLHLLTHSSDVADAMLDLSLEFLKSVPSHNYQPILSLKWDPWRTSPAICDPMQKAEVTSRCYSHCNEEEPVLGYTRFRHCESTLLAKERRETDLFPVKCATVCDQSVQPSIDSACWLCWSANGDMPCGSGPSFSPNSSTPRHLFLWCRVKRWPDQITRVRHTPPRCNRIRYQTQSISHPHTRYSHKPWTGRSCCTLIPTRSWHHPLLYR